MMQIEFMMETCDHRKHFPVAFHRGLLSSSCGWHAGASVFVGGVNLVETLGHLLLINCYQL